MAESAAVTAAILLAIAAFPQPALGAECPATLDLNIRGITRADANAARRYAECMSVPWLPTAEQLAGKTATCAPLRGAASRERLKRAVAWVDHIASQFPGCEIRLAIKPT